MLLSACVYSEAGFVVGSPYIQLNTLLLFLNTLQQQTCFAVPINFQAKGCSEFSVYSVENKLVLRLLSILTHICLLFSSILKPNNALLTISAAYVETITFVSLFDQVSYNQLTCIGHGKIDRQLFHSFVLHEDCIVMM